MVRGSSKLWPVSRSLLGRECDQYLRNGGAVIVEQASLGYHSLTGPKDASANGYHCLPPGNRQTGAAAAAAPSLISSRSPRLQASFLDGGGSPLGVDTPRRFSVDAEATDLEHKSPDNKESLGSPALPGESSPSVTGVDYGVSPFPSGTEFKFGNESRNRSGGWSASPARGNDAQSPGGRSSPSEYQRKPQPNSRTDRYMRSRNNSSVANVLNMLELASSSAEVEKIMERQVPDPAVSSRWPWLPLLEALQRGPKPHLALEVFNWKKNRFAGGDPREYAKLISMAGRLNQLNVALTLFKEMEEKGLKRLPITCNALMSAYSKNGQVGEAVAIFEQMSQDPDCKPTLVTYNTLISIYSKADVAQMERYYDLCKQSGFQPDRVTFNSLIWGYMRGVQFDKMEEVYEQLKRRVGKPDPITFSGLIIGFSKANDIEKSEKAFNHMQEEGFPVTTMVSEILTELFAFGKKFDKMERVMKIASSTPGVSCNARMYGFAVQSYAESGRVHDMERTMDKMFTNNRLFTSAKTLESVIACYASYNNFEGLAMVLERIRSMGWVYQLSTYHALLFEYGSKRELGRMEEVFKELEDAADLKPTEETYGILADSYRGAGDELGLKKIIDRMSAAGFKTKDVVDAKIDSSWTDEQIFDGAPR